MASVEVTESVRKAWNKYCRRQGRIMKDFTSETLKAVIKGEYIRVPKKPVKITMEKK